MTYRRGGQSIVMGVWEHEMPEIPVYVCACTSVGENMRLCVHLRISVHLSGESQCICVVCAWFCVSVCLSVIVNMMCVCVMLESVQMSLCVCMSVYVCSWPFSCHPTSINLGPHYC